ncbi:MAG: hypothetical protein V3U11_06580 [Planctomycetota bacterium]
MTTTDRPRLVARRVGLSSLLLLVSVSWLPAQERAQEPAQGLGRIQFPTSARSADAQEAFVRGVLLLHSFEYEDARDEFRAAQKHRRDFAMAYWGEALTFHHPIWKREEADQARKALAKLGPTPAARRAKAPTDKEKAWLGTVEVLFGEGTRRQRWTGYSAALGRLHQRYPEDVEVAALYSLSVLGTSFDGRDFRIYMRAAGIAQPFYRRHPDHPGLLHYLIHCYDDPVHAPLGLPMARRYDKVAPAAGHALHMPSHIYVALGMWKESVRSNVASFAAGDARWQRKKLGVDARNWHACQWLAYSHLQRGQVKAAARLLQEVKADNRKSKTKRMRKHLVWMRAAYLVDTAWTHPPGQVEVDLKGLYRSVVAADHFVRGMAALARDDVAAAKQHLAAVNAIAPASLVVEAGAGSVGGDASCCLPSGERPESVQGLLVARTVVAQLEAALALHDGRGDEALLKMQAACKHADTMTFDFGPPLVVKPAHEQLGEHLLSVGKPAQAEKEFLAALERGPRRARSLLGLARALRAQGKAKTAQARAVYQELARIWGNADVDLPGLGEVRREAGSGKER